MDSHDDALAGLPFEVIPVIDLMGAQVVHAQRGDRAHYRPIRSSLCNSARIEDVVGGLLGLFPFRRLYIADLDALLGGPPQFAAIDRARRAAGETELWIDSGIRAGRDVQAIADRGTPVLASESLDAPAADRLLAQWPSAVLSIDYRGDRFLGPPGLLERPQAWPSRVIAMNLERVGSGLGPDLERIRSLRILAPNSGLFAAGGVRDAHDLAACRDAGASGALVASSLHDGRLGKDDLHDAGRPGPHRPR